MSFVINPGIIQPPLTAGGVVYGTGSSAKVSAAGTATYVLTSNGAAAPTFQAPVVPPIVGSPAGAAIFTLQYSGGL